MRTTGAILGSTVAVFTLMAADAQAIEIEQLLGRWSSAELDECQYPDNSEGAPLAIRAQDGETLIGNYGWLCSVKNWTKDGDFLVGAATGCAQEGGDDTFDEEFVLGLSHKDELLMAKDAAQGLRRCPVQQ